MNHCACMSATELDTQKIHINNKHHQEFEEFGLIDLGMKLSY